MMLAPDLRILDEALPRRYASNIRFETVILVLLVILTLCLLACFLSDSWEPAAMTVPSAVAGTFLVPALLIPCKLTPVARGILLNSGILRLLPRRLPW
jgi:hypothetical protein